MSIKEHARATQFWATYANDVPHYRSYLSNPKAIPLLVQNIKLAKTDTEQSPLEIDNTRVLCLALNQLQFDWCITEIAPLDLCPKLMELLVCV